ncbi:MAG: hypothetical protein R3B69_03695 [Candidatus Paceibacterota bacterium]
MRTALFIIACMALGFPALAEMPANVRVVKAKSVEFEIKHKPVAPRDHLVNQVMPDCQLDRQLAHIQDKNEDANELFAHDWDIDPSGGAMTDSKFAWFHEDVGIPAHCLVRINFELEGETAWALVLHTYRQDYVLAATEYEDGTSQGVPVWSNWIYANFITAVEELSSGDMIPVR